MFKKVLILGMFLLSAGCQNQIPGANGNVTTLSHQQASISGRFAYLAGRNTIKDEPELITASELSSGSKITPTISTNDVFLTQTFVVDGKKWVYGIQFWLGVGFGEELNRKDRDNLVSYFEGMGFSASTQPVDGYSKIFIDHKINDKYPIGELTTYASDNAVSSPQGFQSIDELKSIGLIAIKDMKIAQMNFDTYTFRDNDGRVRSIVVNNKLNQKAKITIYAALDASNKDMAVYVDDQKITTVLINTDELGNANEPITRNRLIGSINELTPGIHVIHFNSTALLKYSDLHIQNVAVLNPAN